MRRMRASRPTSSASAATAPAGGDGSADGSGNGGGGGGGGDPRRDWLLDDSGELPRVELPPEPGVDRVPKKTNKPKQRKTVRYSVWNINVGLQLAVKYRYDKTIRRCSF